MRNRLRVATAALALTVTALTSCGEQQHTPAAERTGSLNVSLLRVSAPDFPTFETPEAYAAQVPIVVAGVIDGWQQGPATETYENGPLDYRVILRVRITHRLKGPVGDLAHVALDQGAVVRDDSVPAERWKPARSVADFEKGLPSGTRILVFARELPAEAFTGRVRVQGNELPLLSVGPLGLVLEDPVPRVLVGGREPLRSAGGRGWLEPRDMDEMVARLREHGIGDGTPR